jgi:hypothetical protein
MYVAGTIDKGTRPARMVGKQRWLPLKNVLAYKTDNRAKRRQTLRELAALNQELGLEQVERLRSSPFWMAASSRPDA